MCGITGFIINEKNPNKIIKKMADRIAHRGPDAEGFYIDKYIALGHRRLSIIDLNTGAQPMSNQDKSLVTIFNGEIYNYLELKQELEKIGYKFTTKSDTEVLLHGYKEWKEDLPKKLRGMFAFIIWDIKNKILFGARDHFGIKPFYYYNKGKTFMFSSEIKSFLEHPQFEKILNKDALKPYLCFQYSVLDETFFKNTFRLNPGCSLVYKNGNLEIKKYFELNTNRTQNNYDILKKEISKTLEESIKYHQISDVEVGSFLSGGVDSSYVVSVAKPDKTFTVGFDYNGFDETLYARELSKLLKIDIDSKLITKDEFISNLAKLQYHADEPHANLSMIPLYFLAQMASKKVKVVLSGEGSDEMFAGYNDYNEHRLIKTYLKVPRPIRATLASIASRLPRFIGQTSLIEYAKPIEKRYMGPANIMTSEEANQLLAPEYQSDISTHDILKPYYDKVKNKNDIEKKLYIDMNFWLPKDILLKADKMTMANSLELRVPFLDKEVYKIASTINTKEYIKKEQTKAIFREVANEKIPEEWAKRRKLGFPVPFKIWLQDEETFKDIKKELTSDLAKQFFNQEMINKLFDEQQGKRPINGRKIYTIYSFLLWYKVYFKNEKW